MYIEQSVANTARASMLAFVGTFFYCVLWVSHL